VLRQVRHKKVREYHIPDFSNWKHEEDFEKAFADIMCDLRAKAEQGKGGVATGDEASVE